MEKAETSSRSLVFLAVHLFQTHLDISTPRTSMAPFSAFPEKSGTQLLLLMASLGRGREEAQSRDWALSRWNEGHRSPGSSCSEHRAGQTSPSWEGQGSSALSFPASGTKSGKVVLSSAQLLCLHFGKLIFTLPQNCCGETESPGTPSEPKFRSLTATKHQVKMAIKLLY